MFAAPPTDAGLDSDLGSLEAESTPQTGCAREAFFFTLRSSRATAIREHEGLLQSSSRWYLSK